MANTFFLTGYPGFLASSLIQQLILDHHKTINHIYLLVLPMEKEKAELESARFLKENQLPADFITIVPGDITKPDLGLTEMINNTLTHEVTHVFHLAAIYDLAVPEDIAINVNINGTKHVNNWVKTLPRLKRYIYFSTAYVSGTREGRIYEHELRKGQTFRNHYEKTKYEAELLVDELKEIIPTTIIRPGIVKGHATTGYTIKFDGLYFMLIFLEKFSSLPIAFYFGKGEAEGNFVPADYVLKATSFLAVDDIGEGKTYHLTDPNPYKMWEIQKMLTECYLGKTPKYRLPISVVKSTLSIAPIRKRLQVEKETMDYFTIHSSYDATQAVTDLAETNIVCPDLKDTLEPMIEYYRKYKHDKEKHIVIH